MKRYMIASIILLGFSFSQGRVSYVNNDDRARFSPRLLNYQGYLTDTLGNPITNPSLSMAFAIFDVVSGGSQKWTETQGSVIVNKGIFHVLLGSVTPIPDSVFTNSTSRYLQLTVAGQVLSPRTRIVSAAYAYTATYSDTATFADTATYARKTPLDRLWLIYQTEGADTSLRAGGRWGLARLGNNLLGNADSTHINWGVGSSTGLAGQNFKYCVVGGGLYNRAGNQAATVAGGDSNTINGACATIGGGALNIVNGNYGTVGGGFADSVLAPYGGVGSGFSNNAGEAAADTAAAVAGGWNNRADGKFCFVGGGISNRANLFGAAVLGGNTNYASVLCGVGSGYGNQASDTASFVGGGWNNNAEGRYEFIGGGMNNYSTGDYAVIGGGRNNTARGNLSTIGGGYYNWTDSNYATVAGGTNDTARAYCATVSGGRYNTASAEYATVCGGIQNRADSDYAVVSGGSNNTAIGLYAIVSGGYGNTASGRNSFVSSGQYNVAGGELSVVCGGLNNVANAYAATVVGGYSDTVAGSYSLAAGERVRLTSTADYTFAFGRNFTTTAANAVIFRNSMAAIRVGIDTIAPANILTIRINSPTDPIADAWTIYSSRGYKENITELGDEECKLARDRLMETPVVKYRYKGQAGGSKMKIGIIAEDAPEELLAEGDDDAISLNEYISMLHAALKAQQKEIDKLKAEIEDLKE